MRGRAIATNPGLIASRGFVYRAYNPNNVACEDILGIVVGGINITNVAVEGGPRGAYEIVEDGLTKGTHYCYSSYIQVSGRGYLYGENKAFRTLDLAVIEPIALVDRPVTLPVPGENVNLPHENPPAWRDVGAEWAYFRGKYVSSTTPVKRIGFVFSKTAENANPFPAQAGTSIVDFCFSENHCATRMVEKGIENGGIVVRGTGNLSRGTEYTFRMFVDNSDGRAVTPKGTFTTVP
jgi:hypothetical protein